MGAHSSTVRPTNTLGASTGDSAGGWARGGDWGKGAAGVSGEA